MPIVHVIATTFEGTRAALAVAIPLAKGAGSQLIALVPRIVSSAAETGTPADATELLAERYAEIARQWGGQAQIDICTSVGLEDLIAKVCAAHSLVVVGGPVGRWLTSPEERFANRLAVSGCQVVFAACGPNTTQRRVAA